MMTNKKRTLTQRDPMGPIAFSLFMAGKSAELSLHYFILSYCAVFTATSYVLLYRADPILAYYPLQFLYSFDGYAEFVILLISLFVAGCTLFSLFSSVRIFKSITKKGGAINNETKQQGIDAKRRRYIRGNASISLIIFLMLTLSGFAFTSRYADKLAQHTAYQAERLIIESNPRFYTHLFSVPNTPVDLSFRETPVTFSHPMTAQGSVAETNMVAFGSLLPAITNTPQITLNEKGDPTPSSLTALRHYVLMTVAAARNFELHEQQGWYQQFPGAHAKDSRQYKIYESHKALNAERYYEWAAKTLPILHDMDALIALRAQFNSEYDCMTPGVPCGNFESLMMGMIILEYPKVIPESSL